MPHVYVYENDVLSVENYQENFRNNGRILLWCLTRPDHCPCRCRCPHVWHSHHYAIKLLSRIVPSSQSKRVTPVGARTAQRCTLIHSNPDGLSGLRSCHGLCAHLWLRNSTATRGTRQQVQLATLRPGAARPCRRPCRRCSSPACLASRAVVTRLGHTVPTHFVLLQRQGSAPCRDRLLVAFWSRR